MSSRFAAAARRIVLLLAGCVSLHAAPLLAQASSTPPPPSPATHEVVDEFGRTIRVPLVPERIVSLAPNITETIYALGVQDHLVGDTNYCDYPPDAQKKTKVGSVINPNLEQIAALHPDLVLVTKEGNRLDTVRALDTLGIPAYATEARTVDDVLATTKKLADLFGVPEAGKSLDADLQARLDQLHARLDSVPPSRVLFVVWTEPLQSIGRSTFVADALRKAGATSIVDSSQDWPQVSLEEVVRLQPDYLIFTPSHGESGSHDFDSVSTLPGWRVLDAVRNRHFAVASEAIIRPAPRIIAAIEDLARQLHPTAFSAPLKPEPQKFPQPGSSAPSMPAHVALDVPPSAQELACAR